MSGQQWTNMDQVTIDTIISYFDEQIRNKQPIAPHLWLDAAQKINILLEDEQDKLFDLEQAISTQKRICIERGDSVAKAKVIVESSDVFKDARKQKARIDRLVEFGRLAKQYSRTGNNIMSGY